MVNTGQNILARGPLTLFIALPGCHDPGLRSTKGTAVNHEAGVEKAKGEELCAS
jgi:hypothetical protein